MSMSPHQVEQLLTFEISKGTHRERETASPQPQGEGHIRGSKELAPPKRGPGGKSVGLQSGFQFGDALF
jgi:hypothetical protein